MNRVLRFVLIGALSAGLVGCASNAADPVTPEASADMRPAVEKVTIPSGARVRVALIDGVSTEKSSPGDEFMASLAEPIVVNGKTVIASGTKVRGRVVDVNESGRIKGRASISLILTSIATDGRNVSIDTKPFVAVAEATKKRDAAIIGGAAGIGAAIGAIAGGGDGAAKGALIGGGAGTGTVLATKGNDLNYPPETRLNFTLSKAITVQM
jgi:hypothetical protein